MHILDEIALLFCRYLSVTEGKGQDKFRRAEHDRWNNPVAEDDETCIDNGLKETLQHVNEESVSFLSVIVKATISKITYFDCLRLNQPFSSTS